jgi:dipeptide/tripeptide permease
MIADCVGIVIATPIALGYVNPSLDRLSGGQFGHRAKFALGMLLGGSSVYLAARMEVSRRLAPILQETSNCAPDGVHMSEQSAMLMFVPFLLMGIGEIYTQPVLMHFAYTNSPSSMRTFGAIVTMVIGAVSNALFTVQIAALKRYVPNDLNQGNLEYGYYANLLLGIIFFYGFVVAMGNFERRTDIL